MTRAFPYPEKILVGIQGLCGECAEVYMASLPEKVQNARTFRDILKRDSLKEQKEKFAKRGENERKALKNVGHITGRTDWDYGCTNKVSKARYHFMNETLRSVFYEGNWEYEKCIPHSIFLSQGDYPLKGLHFVLEAMPLILEKYPDTTLLIAGNDLTKSKTLMEKIKISAYGKYLRKLICEKRLQDKVHFLGRLTAAQMKQQFLESNLYLCSSILENSPNSLGEAMLLGVPSIAADTGGIPSVFTDKKDGLLFERGNVKALANCVIEMFNDSKMQQVYSENAKRHARKTHDPDTNYHRLLEIYGEIVCK